MFEEFSREDLVKAMLHGAACTLLKSRDIFVKAADILLKEPDEQNPVTKILDIALDEATRLMRIAESRGKEYATERNVFTGYNPGEQATTKHLDRLNLGEVAVYLLLSELTGQTMIEPLDMSQVMMDQQVCG